MLHAICFLYWNFDQLLLLVVVVAWFLHPTNKTSHCSTLVEQHSLILILLSKYILCVDQSVGRGYSRRIAHALNCSLFIFLRYCCCTMTSWNFCLCGAAAHQPAVRPGEGRSGASWIHRSSHICSSEPSPLHFPPHNLLRTSFLHISYSFPFLTGVHLFSLPVVDLFMVLWMSIFYIFFQCSRDDVGTRLRKDIKDIPAVHISNPKTLEFQVRAQTQNDSKQH